MTIILGLDLETTGLDPKTDEIIEIGAVLWCTERNKVLEIYSALVCTEKEISPKITEITGIDKEMLNKSGVMLGKALSELYCMTLKADYLMAHNAPFDREFILNAKAISPVQLELMKSKPWIDSKTDLPYQNGNGDGVLTLIAANHGFINPFPHRALFDVMTMFKVFAQYDFAEIQRYASSPIVTLAISFPYDATGERNGKVRGLGYHWKSDVKQWRRKVKEFQVSEAIAKASELGFLPRVLESDEVA